MSNFYWWLMKQAKRDDPVGDLARDARADTAARSMNEEAFRKHLADCGACADCFTALDEAVSEWKAAG